MATAQPFITISTVVWQKKIAEYAHHAKLNMREALYEEWPFLMRKIMDMTPPFATKKSRGPDKLFAASASDLSVGRKAVAFDIYKTMKPFDPKEIRTKSLKKIVEEKNFAAFAAFAANSKDPRLVGATAVAFSPQVHLSQRNARGRVPGRNRNVRVLGTDVALLHAYVAQVQKRVGYAKSGWLKALLLVGGTAPSYVAKQGTDGGEVIDDHANEDNPSITAINRTPWAVRKDEGDRILADAKASRIEAITRKVKFKIDEAAKAAKLSKKAA